MAEQLYNKKSKEELKRILDDEGFERITLSFYKYIPINNLDIFRDKLYSDLTKLSVLGRIYIADEGINAQISVPKDNKKMLHDYINSIDSLSEVQVKEAIEDGKSFYKLVIKVKNEIVAYGMNDNEYDMKKVGKHLSPKEFNKALENPNTIIVDIRNHYESEVGRFENAIIPDVDRSQDLLPEVREMLKGKEDKKVLLYCTGGIRCEKASSYLIKNSFKDINQLNGGVINYAHEVKNEKLKSKFIGKNFVFDNRLGERITSEIISICHQCNEKSDAHANCANDLCHLLFIQCEKCKSNFSGCCSKECFDYLNLNGENKERKKKEFLKFNKKRHRGRVKPKLYEILN